MLEASSTSGTRRSFRGAPPEALVRTGSASERDRAGRDRRARQHRPWSRRRSLPAGRSRTRVNRKPVSARKDLAAAVPCTIFSPEDLAIVSGAPKGRRDLLDDALALLDPEGARAADETDRVLRQRAALLRQSGGRVSDDVATTLDVWDERLADAGKVLVAARERLVERPRAAGRGGLQPPGRGRGRAGAGPAGLPAVLGRATCSTRSRPAGPTTCGGG